MVISQLCVIAFGLSIVVLCAIGIWLVNMEEK